MKERLDDPDARVALERLLAVTGASFETRAQLEHALESRIVIEQAKGILAERLDMAVDEAFRVLRAASRSHRVRIHDLAASVVPGTETPAEILAVLDRPRK